MHCAISTLLLALCFQHCAISTVLLALSNQHCANRTMLSALCYYAVLAKLGLIQGNSRCFGANCKMSQNTRFLCYYFGLKYSSVLFFTLIPSLKISTNMFIFGKLFNILTKPYSVPVPRNQIEWKKLRSINTVYLISMFLYMLRAPAG